MPYLRLSSRTLDDATKRHLADELTATLLDVLRDQRPEWTTVHFTPFVPSDVAVAGRLVSEGAALETHLAVLAPDVDDKSWFALRNRFTDVIADALGVDSADRRHIAVQLDRQDSRTFAVGGMTLVELAGCDERAAGDGEPDDRAAERTGGWGRPIVVAGFALGAYLGYRWFAGRVGTDVVAHAAPPLAGPRASSASATGERDAAPAAEY